MTRKTECPRCEALQSFPRLLRDTDIDGVKEVYIRCTTCNYDQIIGYTTDKLEQLRTQRSKLEAKAGHEESRHGVPSHATSTALVRAQERFNEETAYLARRLKEAKGGEHSDRVDPAAA